MMFNLALQKEGTFGTEDFQTAISNSLQYNYLLTSQSKNFVSHGLAVYLKTQIAKNCFLISSLDYEFRPSTGNFDYRTDQIQKITSVETGDYYNRSSNFSIVKEDLQENILSVKLGLVKQF